MERDIPTATSDKGVRGSLMTGGLAALLASTCCLGPLVLITLGVSGAWISNLTALEPYRPAFILTAVISLFYAWRRIRRPAAHYEPGQICAVPRVNRSHRMLFWLVAALVAVALGFSSIAPWFY